MTCGVQYGESDAPLEHCLICEDERQYIGKDGQRWYGGRQTGDIRANAEAPTLALAILLALLRALRLDKGRPPISRE